MFLMLFDGEFLMFQSCNVYMKILKLSFIKFRNKIVIKITFDVLILCGFP